MNFWLKNIILGGVLALLAWAFFVNKDLLLSINSSLEQDESSEITTSDTALNSTASKSTEKKIKPKKKSTNAAADGLSKFYANIYGDSDSDGPKIVNNIVYLPDPLGDLAKILQVKELTVRPYKKTWTGQVESRPFRTGETLNQKLDEYSAEEGIELLWWLNRDYVVKEPFRIKKDMLRTTFLVAKAIEGHFESGLSIFFCHQQRTIVVVESAPHPFLDSECNKIESTNGY